MLDKEKLMGFLEEYQKRITKFRELTFILRNVKEYENWVSHAQNCAEQMQEIYLKNAEDLQTILLPYLKEDYERTAEDYGILKEFLDQLYVAEAGDMFLFWQALDVIFPYYDEKGNKDEKITVNMWYAFVLLEMSRIFPKRFGDQCIECYEKILRYEYDVDEFQDPSSSLRMIAIAYANLLIVASNIPIITVEQAYGYYCRLEKLMNSPVYESYAKNDRNAGALMEAYAQRFREEGYELYVDNPKGTSKETVKILMRFQEEIAAGDDEKEQGQEDSSPEVVVTKLKLQIAQNELSYDEAWKSLHEYTLKHRELLNYETDDVVDFYMMCMLNLILMLEHTTMSFEERKVHAMQYLDILEEFIRDYDYHSATTYTIGNVLSAIAFNPLFYSYMSTIEEKIQFLYRFVLTRHIATCLHSHMVAELAETILKYVIREKSEFLVGVYGMQTEQQVRQSQKKFLEFIRNAALLHDIGKCTMLDIIDTQYRPIFDREFEMIKEHPNKGAEVLILDQDLRVYEDFARGHHKFFDGTGGYPRNCTVRPENQKLVGLITLCDCLDAATDTLGRNYRRAKTVSQVLEEFREGAGTRYDPELVELICSNKALQDEIVTIVTRKRKEIAQQLMYGENEKF